MPPRGRWGTLSVGGDMVAAAVIALACYVAVGIAVALAFVATGVTHVQPAPVTLGARVLLLPGATLLWPVVLSRWVGSGRAP